MRMWMSTGEHVARVGWFQPQGRKGSKYAKEVGGVRCERSALRYAFLFGG